MKKNVADVGKRVLWAESEPPDREVLRIYTDGSHFPKTDCGGWAFLLCRKGEKPRLVSGSASGTSALEMEFTAVIEALNRVTLSTRATILTDFQPIVTGMMKKLPKIARAGWKGSNKPKKIQHRCLWMDMLSASHDKRIAWEWVQSRSKHPEHRYVDAHARREANARFQRMVA